MNDSISIDCSDEGGEDEFYDEIEVQPQYAIFNQQDPQEEVVTTNKMVGLAPTLVERDIPEQLNQINQEETLEAQNPHTINFSQPFYRQTHSILNKQQEIAQKPLKKDENFISHLPAKKQENIPQVTPLPLVEKGQYSLVSDIKLGWRPKDDMGRPQYLCEVPPVVAFIYSNDIYSIEEQQKINHFQNQFLNNPHPLLGKKTFATKVTDDKITEQDQNLIYQGFRPRDSLEIHENFKQKFYKFEYPNYQNLNPSNNN